MIKVFYLRWCKSFIRCLYASQVRDFDKFSRNTVLGDVRVPLGQLNISYPLELQEDLKIPQKVLQGALTHTPHSMHTGLVFSSISSS